MNERPTSQVDGGNPFATEEAVGLYTDRVQDPTLFPQEREAVDRYFTKDGAAVLDIGCGTGRVSHLLDERGFDVTGIDVSEPLVERAGSLFPEVDFYVADIRDPPFEASSFDYAVFSFFGLDYVVPRPERVEALRQIRRVLKPSGIFVFSSHNSWYPLVPLSTSDLRRGVADVLDLYLSEKNRDRLGSPYKIESVPLGEVEIYLSNPVRQWIELRKQGFTPVDVVGKRDDVLRFFERDPHYVAKT